VNDEIFTVLKDLSAGRFRFAAPEGVEALQHSFPPSPELVTRKRPSSVSALGNTLGTAPLWLGPSFRGHPLRRVEVGTEGFRAKPGTVLMPARFVSFDYGVVKLQEFGAQRSFRLLQGPRSGQALVFNDDAEITRGRLLVVAHQVPSRTRTTVVAVAGALAVARALRPLPR
jgi:hypothetical protein